MKDFFNKWSWRALKVISYFFPKSNKIWVFGAWQGELYADNSKYLFEYVNSNHKNITAIWIAEKEEVVEQVRSLGYRSYRKVSIKGIFYCLRAGVCFETEGNQDIMPIVGTGKQKVIQLWHGMGIKAVGLESGWYRNISPEELEQRKASYRKIHGKRYWMCASEEARGKYSRSFAVPEQQFIITGQPKDDTFVNLDRNPEIEKIRISHPGARIAVYLPTHRNFGKDMDVEGLMSIETLHHVNEMLADQNVVMIFKPHFHEFKKYAGYEEALSNIVFATDKKKYGDVYEFLPYCDLLITDYSGIMFGYLASGKPIIYFAYDYEQYVNGDAGFCYDYADITYGPICKTWEETIEKAATITAKDYENERERQRSRFCPYYDGKSCERVYEEVLRILEN